VNINSIGGRRRWGRIPAATDYSGLSRTSLYKLAADNPGLFKKHGAATIVDFRVLDRILESSPAAEISAPV
jgi:hypothetical protein